jgi:hypothetical protein
LVKRLSDGELYALKKVNIYMRGINSYE